MLIPAGLRAQIDKEIKSFVDSTELIVTNGRKMLLEKISKGDNLKAMEIYLYLTNVTAGKNYSAFYYNEDVMINLLFCDWINLQKIMLEYRERNIKPVYAASNQMISILQNTVSTKSDSLFSECEKSGIDDETVKLLEIILYYIKTGTADSEYNSKLTAFNKEFKPTHYEDLLKYFIPGRKVKASIAFSFGSGVVIPTDNLSDYFSGRASFNFSMDINIQKVFTSLYLDGAELKLKEPFTGITSTDVLVFSKDEPFHYLDAGLKAGYFILRNEKVHFAPFVSASGAYLESKRFDYEDNGHKEFKVFNSFVCGAGIHTEMKIASFKAKAFYGYPTGSYVSLKLEGGLNYITKTSYPNYSGNTPYLTVALTWGIGDF